jgi:protein-disulfide isomerase
MCSHAAIVGGKMSLLNRESTRLQRTATFLSAVASIATIVLVCYVAVTWHRLLDRERGSTYRTQPPLTYPTEPPATRPTEPPATRGSASGTLIPSVETTANSTTLNHPGAKIAIVEFSDFQCPFCARYVRDTYSQLRKQLVDNGVVDYVFRNYPLSSHPLAVKAAQAAECAGAQRKYWQMHDTLFANQDKLQDAELRNHARTLGLDIGAFEACLADNRTASKVREDTAEGTRLGVTGTPTFFIGIKEPTGKIRLSRRFTGVQSYESFKLAIDELARDRARQSDECEPIPAVERTRAASSTVNKTLQAASR